MRSIKIPRLILLLAAILGLLGWALALLVLTWHIDVLGPGTDWLAFYGAARAYLRCRGVHRLSQCRFRVVAGAARRVPAVGLSAKLSAAARAVRRAVSSQFVRRVRTGERRRSGSGVVHRRRPAGCAMAGHR